MSRFDPRLAPCLDGVDLALDLGNDGRVCGDGQCVTLLESQWLVGIDRHRGLAVWGRCSRRGVLSARLQHERTAEEHHGLCVVAVGPLQARCMQQHVTVLRKAVQQTGRQCPCLVHAANALPDA